MRYLLGICLPKPIANSQWFVIVSHDDSLAEYKFLDLKVGVAYEHT